VDREHGLDVTARLGALVELAQEHRGERRLPVVAVQHIALELGQLFDGLADRLREEREALAVVVVAVDAVALEVGLVVYEVEVDTLVGELLDAAVDATPRKGNVEVCYVGHPLLVLLGNRGVLREDDGAFRPCGIK
jgi:hypothetical protein